MSADNNTELTYTLVKTMGRRIDTSALIEQIDAGDIPLNQLAQIYYDIYFIVNVKNYKNPKVLYFNELPLETQTKSVSINDFFRKIKNVHIPYLRDELPQHVRGEVYAWDVHSWDFRYQSYQLGSHPNARIEEEDKTDLLLWRESDTDHYHETVHSLVSINGLFHYYEFMQKGWAIPDGNKTRLKNPNKTHIGILDFTQIGEIQLRRITDDMILPGKDNAPLHEMAYIDTKENLKNKTVGICIGGYFHLLDHTYKRVSNRMLKINFSNIKLESLYYKMKELIDVSSLPITDFGDDRVLGFELYHDSTIRELLKLPQSFIVIINNPTVVVYEEPVGHMGLPNRYESAIPPIYPLRIGEGRYPTYKAIKEFDRWVLAVEDNIVPLQVRYQKKNDKFSMIHNRIYPINGEEYARAHFMRIMSDRDLKIRDLDNVFEDTVKTLGPLKPYLTKLDNSNLDYHRDNSTQYYMPKKIIDIDFENEYYKVPTSRY